MKLQAIQCAQMTQTALMDHPLVYLTRKGEEYVYYFDLGESLYKLIFNLQYALLEKYGLAAIKGVFFLEN